MFRGILEKVRVAGGLEFTVHSGNSMNSHPNGWAPFDGFCKTLDFHDFWGVKNGKKHENAGWTWSDFNLQSSRPSQNDLLTNLGKTTGVPAQQKPKIEEHFEQKLEKTWKCTMNMVRFWSPELSTLAKWSPKHFRKFPGVFSSKNLF